MYEKQVCGQVIGPFIDETNWLLWDSQPQFWVKNGFWMCSKSSGFEYFVQPKMVRMHLLLKPAAFGINTIDGYYCYWMLLNAFWS